MSNVVLLPLDEVWSRIAISRHTYYNRINPKSKYYDPDFPKPISIGGGKNPTQRIVESELNEWIDLQVKKSRGE